MQYLSVKNWTEFQHYRDRNPPWIKLHRSLLDDYEFGSLTDINKAHLIMIWVLASQCNGRIPDDPKFLQAKLSLDKQPDLQALVRHGFLIPEQGASPGASKALAERKHDDSNVLALARSREERREEAEKNNDRFARFWSAYPRKVAKPVALKAWRKLALSDAQFERLLGALEEAKKSLWGGRDLQYIPHPATWINGERWTDELPIAAVVERTVAMP